MEQGSWIRGRGSVETRARFRQLVRSVMFNRIWLMDRGEQKFTLNVKRNIAMLVRPQRKIGILTIAEKSILRTPHALRTKDERMKLVKLISGLACFSRIPPKVRARLVPVIKFLVLGPGRQIIKQGHPPTYIYFVLSGEVEVSRRSFNPFKKIWEEKVESISGPGDCIGDIELCEKCNRLNTYTTRNDVELLVLYDDEFDEILRPVMGKYWNDKKMAINSLGYFSFFSEEQKIIACKMGVVREYDPLDTIYIEDKGLMSYVHFVVSGDCQILQCLKMIVTRDKTGRTYQLVDVPKAPQMNLNLAEGTEHDLFRKANKEEQTGFVYNVEADIMSLDEEVRNARLQARKRELKRIEIGCGIASDSFEDEEEEMEYSSRLLDEVYNDVYGGDVDMTGISEYSSHIGSYKDNIAYQVNQRLQRLRPPKANQKLTIKEEERKDSKQSFKENERRPSIKINTESQRKNSILSVKENQSRGSILSVKDRGSIGSNRSFSSTSRSYMTIDYSGSSILSGPRAQHGPRIEQRFIEVGHLTIGALFGLGESMEHRVIMAHTTVQCFLLPRYWLMKREQNPGNIWDRRRFNLDINIPSRQTLFENFVATRRWHSFKTDMIISNIPLRKSNPTKVEDIPLVCRILDIGFE